MQKTFVWRRDPETDSWGFMPQHCPPSFFAGDGITVVHDMLEHWFKKDGGQLHFELMAMGASRYVRGDDWFPNSTWAKVMSEVFVQMLEYAAENPRFRCIVDPPRTRRLDSYIEDQFEDFVYAANKHDVSHIVFDDWEQLKFSILLAARGWLRHGYRCAQKRYKKYGVNINYTSQQLYELAYKVYKHLRNEDSGEHLVVFSCQPRKQPTCKIINQDVIFY
jgi:hypothetical protein